MNQNTIRAVYGEHTIRVYQAYSDPIADAALAHGTFVSPSFKMERMTWIKPSFFVRRRQLLPELAAAFAPPPRRKLYQLLHKFIPV